MPVDLREMHQLHKWLLEGNKKFTIASAMWLNRAAYHTRLLAIEEINKSMTIRNKGFVKASLRYEKTPRSASLNNLVSYTGSISLGTGKGATTGWAEQERVKPDKRGKIIALAARGRNKRRVVPRGHRMNASGSMRSPKDYKGGNAHRRACAMLAHIERTNDRKPFVIHGHNNFKSGMYKLAGRGQRAGFIPLQVFGTKPAATGRNPWLQRARKMYFRTLNSRAVWGDIVRRVLKPPKKR